MTVKDRLKIKKPAYVKKGVLLKHLFQNCLYKLPLAQKNLSTWAV
jgi:hypothetical protein